MKKYVIKDENGNYLYKLTNTKNEHWGTNINYIQSYKYIDVLIKISLTRLVYKLKGINKKIYLYSYPRMIGSLFIKKIYKIGYDIGFKSVKNEK